MSPSPRGLLFLEHMQSMKLGRAHGWLQPRRRLQLRAPALRVERQKSPPPPYDDARPAKNKTLAPRRIAVFFVAPERLTAPLASSRTLSPFHCAATNASTLRKRRENGARPDDRLPDSLGSNMAHSVCPRGPRHGPPLKNSRGGETVAPTSNTSAAVDGRSIYAWTVGC
ncbi:hypothetical protein MRX96_015217 [Rhipicephalus microplus]